MFNKHSLQQEGSQCALGCHTLGVLPLHCSRYTESSSQPGELGKTTSLKLIISLPKKSDPCRILLIRWWLPLRSVSFFYQGSEGHYVLGHRARSEQRWAEILRPAGPPPWLSVSMASLPQMCSDDLEVSSCPLPPFLTGSISRLGSAGLLK